MAGGINQFRPIDKIIVHTSDSPDDRTSVNAKEIDRWHKERGFRMIGYHYVITKDGLVETGRDLNLIGAHCRGHNLHSVGICWVGRHDCNRSQRRQLIVLINELLQRFNLSVSAVFGHNDFEDGKTCPNIDMAALRSDIERYQKGKV